MIRRAAAVTPYAQSGSAIRVWSNFRREDVFSRKTSTENLDLTPSVHFFNRLLR